MQMESSTLSRSEVDTPKPKKRRNRRPKACQPCRDRKVRCDYGEPCLTCQKRKHTHLCIYDQSPRWLVETRNSETGRAIVESLQSPPYQDSLESVRHSSILSSPGSQPSISQSLHIDPDLPSPATTTTSFHQKPGQIGFLNGLSDNITNICERDDQTGETIYIGQNSSAAFLQAVLSTQDDYSLPLDVSIGSAFGLTNRTPLHPFGSLWSSTANVTLRDILGSLPTTEKLMRYYRAYSSIAIPFVPYLLDQEDFERRLVSVVQILSETLDDSILSQAAADMSYRDLSGYALIFAVLASGCQFADEITSERILTTRVFVACSFECLRLANFYVQPSLDNIQTTLLLEYVVANDSNPGVGWTFLANSVRQAESQGLHLLSPRDSSAPGEQQMHPMWKAIIHMDCTLALAFDRRPQSFLSTRYDAVLSIQRATEVSFFDLLNALNCVKLEWQTAKQMDPILRAVETELYMTKVEQVESVSLSDNCLLKSGKSMETRLHQLIFKLHIEHFKARLYRYGSLAKDASPEKRSHYFNLLETSYSVVIETFLAIKPFSPLVQVAWDLLFYAISSALILGGLQLSGQINSHQPLLRTFLKSLQASSDREKLERPNETSACPFCHGSSVLESLLQRYDEVG